jgi:DNA polymerase-3 subunit delta'
MGGRRIAIIDDADDLGDEGANALLKTLEEPPPRSVLILIGTSADKQLPTIRSRCQVIRFQPLDEETVAGLLVTTGAIDDPAEARRIARYSEGSLQLAANLADAELWDFRRELLAALAGPAIESIPRAAAVLAFVDRAGKEAAPRRARLRQVLAFAAEFYRQALRGLCGADLTDDPELGAAVRQALSAWPGDEETASACVARCLEALAHVDRNAHQAAIIECWMDDLARIIATGQPVTASS